MHDDRSMVERKLSGVYLTCKVDIPYSAFEMYVDYVKNVLENTHLVLIDSSVLANNLDLIYRFEQELATDIQDAFCGPNADVVGDPWTAASDLYRFEIEQKEAEIQVSKETELTEARQFNAANSLLPVKPYALEAAMDMLKKAGFLDENKI